MVAPPHFDAGIFLILIFVGVISWFAYKSLGPIVLLGGIFAFLLLGIIVLDGYDVSSFTQDITSGSSAINQTTWLIGNGQPVGSGYGSQLWLGFIFIILAILTAAVFFIDVINGNLFKGKG